MLLYSISALYYHFIRSINYFYFVRSVFFILLHAVFYTLRKVIVFYIASYFKMRLILLLNFVVISFLI